MPDNTGFLLLGLGALLFLGRGGASKTEDKDNRLFNQGGRPQIGAAPMPRFDIVGYIDTLFGDTATVPVQPPMEYFYPAGRVVTSSGVAAVNRTAPEIITPTTKVQIGGDGGETITASALAVKRSEQIAQQRFEYAANVVPRNLSATLEANRIEEERQKKFAADLIKKRVADQLARNQAVISQTRLDQENAVTVRNESIPPTINYRETAEDEEGLSFGSTAGQSIADPYHPSPIGDFTYLGDEEVDASDTTFYSGPTVFAGEEEDTFVISGGMDSPTVFAGEEEDTFSMAGVQDYGYGVYYGGSEDE